MQEPDDPRVAVPAHRIGDVPSARVAPGLPFGESGYTRKIELTEQNKREVLRSFPGTRGEASPIPRERQARGWQAGSRGC